MTNNTKPSQLPAPVSLTLDEAMQVAGGLSSAQIGAFLHDQRFVLEHIVIGRPAFVVQSPFAAGG